MSTKSKFAPDEMLVAITPLQLDPKHAEEILAIAKNVPNFDPNSDLDLNGEHITRFKTLIELYHDDSSLLDKILVELIETLISHITVPEEDDENKELNQQTVMSLILLKIVSTVRGYKTVIKFLPHEVFLLPRLLKLLELAAAKNKFNDKEYEATTMLLIWFMIVCRNPFDFHTFTDENEISYPTRIIKCLMILKYFLTKYSCLILAETLTRHDDNKDVLEPIINECLERLLITINPSNLIEQISDLQLISSIFKKGKRHELQKYGEYVLNKLTPYLTLEVYNTEARLQTIKVVQRISLLYLKPKPASWRYKCGVRSLEENLKLSGIKIEEDNSEIKKQKFDNEDEVEDVIELEETIKNITEKCINCLLLGICDKQNKIRSSSAKGIGRILSRLPENLADVIITKIIEKNFDKNSSAGLWHGGSMAIAELSQRGCILPTKLSKIMDIVTKALTFEDDARATAINVRDAACYICWSFARGFESKLMTPFMEKIATNLIVTSLFDRSVNVRRAASASFQENVGRNKGFPHGVVLNTIVDYQSVTRIDYCYEELCLQIAEFSEYVIPMLDSLTEIYVTHFQEKLRFLSSESLRHLSKFNPQYVVDVIIPKLMKNSNSPYINTKQGSLLAISAVIRGLYESKTYIIENIKEMDEIKKLIPVLAKKYDSPLASGSELILRALGYLIENLTFTKINLNDDELNEWHNICNRISTDIKKETREYGEKAIRNLMLYYLNDKRRNILNDYIKNYLKKLKSTTYEHERIGAATILGNVPKEFLLNDQFDDKPLNIVIIEKLILSIEEELHHRWVNARVAAINSMTNIILQTDAKNIEKERILGCLFITIRDNTHTNQGLVGQYVRIATITSLITLLPLFESKNLLTKEEIGKSIYLIVEQCCERIDSLRECAGENLKLILEKHCLKDIPDREKLYSIFMNNDIKWGIDAFSPLTPLLTSKYYQKPVILGMINSIGGETTKWLQNLALNELQLHLRKYPQENDNFFELILKQMNSKTNKNDLIIPMRAFGRIFGEGCFYKVESNPDNYPVFVEIVKKISKLALAASINVRRVALYVCQYLFQCNMKSIVFKMAMNSLTMTLSSKVAALRQAAATELQHGVISLDITNGVPNEDLKPILNLLKGRLWNHETDDINYYTELSEKIQSHLSNIINNNS